MPTTTLPQHLKQHILSNTKNYCEINSQELFDDHVADIVVQLNQMPQIKTLELGQTNITNKGIVLLCDLLHVESLTLKRGNFEDAGAIALVHNCQFKSINFYGNRSITDIAGEVMVTDATQTHLILTDTSVTLACLEKINAKLAQNRQKAETATFPVNANGQRFFEESKDPKATNCYIEILTTAQQDRQSVTYSAIRRR